MKEHIFLYWKVFFPKNFRSATGTIFAAEKSTVSEIRDEAEVLSQLLELITFDRNKQIACNFENPLKTTLQYSSQKSIDFP